MNVYSKDCQHYELFNNDCDELFCNPDIDLYEKCNNLSGSSVEVLSSIEILPNMYVFNSKHSTCNKLLSASKDTESDVSLISVPDNVSVTESEATGCHSPANSGLNQVSAFPELHKFRNNNAKQMIFGHLNINSLRNKFFEVYEILSKELLDVFGLSETKLDPSFMSAQYSIPDYSMHRADRDAHGGGILLYVKSTLPHRLRRDLNCEMNSGVELLVIEIKLCKQKMFIILVYKPPNVRNDLCINELAHY